jgi:hypothetical protein
MLSYDQVETWTQGRAVMAVRFLGTTPGSSTIVPMLTSVCSQICVVYHQPMDDMPEELSPLIQHFKKLLTCATGTWHFYFDILIFIL